MNILQRVISIAGRAYERQIDKGGNPYILHPLRALMLLTNVWNI